MLKKNNLINYKLLVFNFTYLLIYFYVGKYHYYLYFWFVVLVISYYITFVLINFKSYPRLNQYIFWENSDYVFLKKNPNIISSFIITVSTPYYAVVNKIILDSYMEKRFLLDNEDLLWKWLDSLKHLEQHIYLITLGFSLFTVWFFWKDKKKC